jgi:hypothetical protein
MTQCAQILGLKLDKASLEAIDRIKRQTKVANALAAALTAGVFNSIFTSKKAPAVGYNITTADWDLYAQALNALPVIAKNRVRQEIDLMLIHYQMPGNYDHKHVQFWKGMKNGCQ